MQAILLLAHKGLDYIDNFCGQFANDNRFNIYIHYDTKLKLSDDDLLYLKNKHTNIKYICSKYSGTYFGMSLIDAEILLIKEASKDNNKYYHLMSEQCYLLCDKNIFYNYFVNSTLQYMDGEYDKEGWQIINNKYHWAGSQWWSFSNEAIHWILEQINNTDYYNDFSTSLNKYNEGRKIRIIAADETFFTNMFKTVPNEFEITDNKRYFDFTWPLVDFMHPHLLVISKLTKYIDDGILENIIARKIDYKKLESKQLLQQILYINRYASNTFISS